MLTELWVGGPLPRRPHPDHRLDRLQAELLADQRPGLPGHAQAVERPAGRRPPIRCRRPAVACSYNPISLAGHAATPGERVLLRIANLGYQHHAMTLDSIAMTVVAKDASLLRRRDGEPHLPRPTPSRSAPARAATCIFTAPREPRTVPTRTCSTTATTPTSTTAAAAGYGGQMTEVRVYPPATSPVQTRSRTPERGRTRHDTRMPARTRARIVPSPQRVAGRRPRC